ncbi:aluminum-activated malate transporter 10 [Humulus lupulus]|uniref:aluminum-activated malate transporter 10 n=1 Tax=Humulus lupulus TaxID=3486 RepID=UPI002B4036F1|nr:aluminum-activated malate transporter 10 [Humulus lupulus]
MAPEKEVSGQVQWSIRITDDSTKVLAPERGLASKFFHGLKGLIIWLFSKPAKFLHNAWKIGCNDPRKVIHCLKVGIALTAVSFFYYMRPLYDGVGGTAMWAVMTVVVVFENTVGATLYKCVNRICGTLLAGFAAIGVHWIARHSGDKFEPYIVGVFVFFLASAATFSRFIPSVKSRFDYGTMIFILTFSFVSISGYRVEKLFDLAHQRLSTIIIGTSLCILIIMTICPIWAGQELHTLITRNMDKLGDSLDGCMADYFSDNNSKESEKSYKCVLSSKAAEDTMANFARWEPAHGRFNFRHPWYQYLEIAAAMRGCAYCIEAFNGCLKSENKAPEQLKKQLSNICLEVSSNSTSVIKEVATMMKTMKKSSRIDFLVEQMNTAVQELQKDLKSFPGVSIPVPMPEDAPPPPPTFSQDDKKTEAANDSSNGAAAASAPVAVPLMEIIPLVTLTSLLIEITVRIKSTVNSVEKLADLAHFRPVTDEKVKKDNKPDNNKIVGQDQHKEDETLRTLQRV